MGYMKIFKGQRMSKSLKETKEENSGEQSIMEFYYPNTSSFIGLFSYLSTFNNEGNLIVSENGIEYNNSSYADIVLNHVEFSPAKCAFRYIPRTKDQKSSDVADIDISEDDDSLILGIDINSFVNSLRSILDYNQNSQLLLKCEDSKSIKIKTCSELMTNNNNSSYAHIQTQPIIRNYLDVPEIRKHVSITARIKNFCKSMAVISGNKNSSITMSVYENSLVFDIISTNNSLNLRKVIGDYSAEKECKGRFIVQPEILKNLSKISNVTNSKILGIYFSEDYRIMNIRVPLYENCGELNIYMNLQPSLIKEKLEKE